ncbi:UDP-N-acetylenolpyruvoylglucosamine reductase [bacterium HR35]|nr:UDP-N-acetylenolpyruvoylglucosamine reductase [bacterium HR35]
MVIEKNKILAPLTNFKIGGEALFFVSINNLNDLEEFLELKNKYNLPTFILGGGTNILFNKFNGFVIKTNFKDFEVIEENKSETIIKIGANLLVSEVLEKLVNLSLANFEWAGGLPGEIGGAIRGNAGCFGREIKDILISAEAFNLETGERKYFENKEINFNYRDSFFKRNKNWLILNGFFRFEKGNPEEIRKIIEEKINYRKEKHPIEYPNAGSIFKNIKLETASEKLKALALEKNKIKNDPFPVIPAAFVISESGLKGFQIGQAKISEKHSNFIINLGGATFEEVYKLIDYIKKRVADEFEVLLEEEIEIVSY